MPDTHNRTTKDWRAVSRLEFADRIDLLVCHVGHRNSNLDVETRMATELLSQDN